MKKMLLDLEEVSEMETASKSATESLQEEENKDPTFILSPRD